METRTRQLCQSVVFGYLGCFVKDFHLAACLKSSALSVPLPASPQPALQREGRVQPRAGERDLSLLSSASLWPKSLAGPGDRRPKEKKMAGGRGWQFCALCKCQTHPPGGRQVPALPFTRVVPQLLQVSLISTRKTRPVLCAKPILFVFTFKKVSHLTSPCQRSVYQASWPCQPPESCWR